MPDQQKPVVRTVPSTLAFTRAVLEGWDAVREPGENRFPPKHAVAVLYAHYIMETGGLNCYGWNIGNVKWTLGCGYDYHCLNGVWEGVSPAMAAKMVASGEAVIDPSASHQASCKPNVSVVFKPPHPASRFRVFPNLEDAMDDHLILLCKKRFTSAWPFVLKGDVVGFAHALKAKGYFTSQAIPYANGMTPSFKHYMASLDYESAVALATPADEAPTLQWVSEQPIVHPNIDFEPYVPKAFDTAPLTLSGWTRLLDWCMKLLRRTP